MFNFVQRYQIFFGGVKAATPTESVGDKRRSGTKIFFWERL